MADFCAAFRPVPGFLIVYVGFSVSVVGNKTSVSVPVAVCGAGKHNHFFGVIVQVPFFDGSVSAGVEHVV